MKRQFTSIGFFIACAFYVTLGLAEISPERGSPEAKTTLEAASLKCAAFFDQLVQDFETLEKGLFVLAEDESKTTEALRKFCRHKPYIFSCTYNDFTSKNTTLLYPEKLVRFRTENAKTKEEPEKKARLSLGKTETMDTHSTIVPIKYFVYRQNKNPAGLLTVYVFPEKMLRKELAFLTQKEKTRIWVMQADGVILYDSQAENIGKNVFDVPLGQLFGPEIALCRKIIKEKEGFFEYESYHKINRQKVKILSYWSTIGPAGETWRLVVR